MRVSIVDDNDMDAMLMKRKVLSMNAFSSVSLLKHAEDVISIFQSFDLVIISNDFGPGYLMGCDAIQRIREQEREKSTARVVIALWTAEEAVGAPGADLIWDKAIAPNKMQAQL